MCPPETEEKVVKSWTSTNTIHVTTADVHPKLGESSGDFAARVVARMNENGDHLLFVNPTEGEEVGQIEFDVQGDTVGELESLLQQVGFSRGPRG